MRTGGASAGGGCTDAATAVVACAGAPTVVAVVREGAGVDAAPMAAGAAGDACAKAEAMMVRACSRRAASFSSLMYALGSLTRP